MLAGYPGLGHRAPQLGAWVGSSGYKGTEITVWESWAGSPVKESRLERNYSSKSDLICVHMKARNKVLTGGSRGEEGQKDTCNAC